MQVGTLNWLCLRLVGRFTRIVGLNWWLCACGKAITPLLFYTHYYVTQSILNKCLVANLMCLALHGMIERNRARIRTLLTVSYSEILTEVRRGAKGLRIAYLFSIQIIGDYPEGLRAVDICRLSGKSAPNIAARLKRCVSAGFVRKQGTRRNLRYYLTEQGQQVYNTIVKESDKAIKEITVLLAAEVRKKLE